MNIDYTNQMGLFFDSGITGGIPGDGRLALLLRHLETEEITSDIILLYGLIIIIVATVLNKG